MKYDMFSIVCNTVGVVFLICFGISWATTGDISASSITLLVFAMVMFIIPRAKRFVLFKIFEFERHDDK